MPTAPPSLSLSFACRTRTCSCYHACHCLIHGTSSPSMSGTSPSSWYGAFPLPPTTHSMCSTHHPAMSLPYHISWPPPTCVSALHPSWPPIMCPGPHHVSAFLSTLAGPQWCVSMHAHVQTYLYRNETFGVEGVELGANSRPHEVGQGYQDGCWCVHTSHRECVPMAHPRPPCIPCHFFDRVPS